VSAFEVKAKLAADSVDAADASLDSDPLGLPESTHCMPMSILITGVYTTISHRVEKSRKIVSRETLVLCDIFRTKINKDKYLSRDTKRPLTLSG
jgi:hypothetical protein